MKKSGERAGARSGRVVAIKHDMRKRGRPAARAKPGRRDAEALRRAEAIQVRDDARMEAEHDRQREGTAPGLRFYRPYPWETDEAYIARMRAHGLRNAQLVCDTLGQAVTAAEMIVHTSPDTMPAEARRAAARAIAEAAHLLTEACTRIAKKEPELIADLAKNSPDWPVLCVHNRAANEDIIRDVFKDLGADREGKSIDMSPRAKNMNWVLWYVIRFGQLPISRTEFRTWPEWFPDLLKKHPAIPRPPFTRATFTVWFQKHFRPFIESVPDWRTHPAFRNTVETADKDRNRPKTGGMWNRIRALVESSARRLGLFEHRAETHAKADSSR